MESIVSIIISVIALFATYYQAYIQRVHNEKSVKPLLQIDLKDQAGVLAINIRNNGVGPAIIEKLIFKKNDGEFFRIQDCLNFDPQSYDHIDVSFTNVKTISPGNILEAFHKEFSDSQLKDELIEYRVQLSHLDLYVEGKDIYDRKITANKKLAWFARYN